ncbi:MAG: putative 2OG-Fe(II) oxygenase [Planctomycetaceae bacterium]
MLTQTTKAGATLHALFPTLVYHMNLSTAEAYADAFEQCRDTYAFNPAVGTSARYNAGEYHGKIHLHQDKRLEAFFTDLAEQVAAYLRVLGMKPQFFNMNCLKSWLVICEPESEENSTSMVAHNHSCSDISWVYYPQVPEDCAPITFHAGRRLATQLFDAGFHYDWHDQDKSAISTVNGWNSDTWSIHPKSGDLLIFPGHQLHSIEVNTTQQPRISAAGDIALTLKAEHQNLEFGRRDLKHWVTQSLGDES